MGPRVLRSTAAVVAIFAAGGVPAGCGSGSHGSGGEKQEVDQIVNLIKSAKPGEFLIEESGPRRAEGPYVFKPGGYVFRFEQMKNRGRLVVSLESKPGSRQEPYQLLVDTAARVGSEQVSLTGRLYVHIVSDGEYLLRFTPNRHD
jgi:hypothetical protein